MGRGPTKETGLEQGEKGESDVKTANAERNREQIERSKVQQPAHGARCPPRLRQKIARRLTKKKGDARAAEMAGSGHEVHSRHLNDIVNTEPTQIITQSKKETGIAAQNVVRKIICRLGVKKRRLSGSVIAGAWFKWGKRQKLRKWRVGKRHKRRRRRRPQEL